MKQERLFNSIERLLFIYIWKYIIVFSNLAVIEEIIAELVYLPILAPPQNRLFHRSVIVSDLLPPIV